MVSKKTTKKILPLLLTILVFGLIAIFVYLLPSSNDPVQVVKTVENSLASGDYPTVFNLSVNQNGQPLSEICKGNLTMEYDNARMLNTTWIRQFGVPAPCSQAPDVIYLFKIYGNKTPPTDCQAVPVNTTIIRGNSTYYRYDLNVSVLKIGNDWKMVWFCDY